MVRPFGFAQGQAKLTTNGMAQMLIQVVQCLTLLVLYPEYTTTKDTKSTKEEKIMLKSGCF